MNAGDVHLFVKRSANALTIAEETAHNEFIKVASLKRPARGDHIVVDAVNSSIVNKAIDPDHSWTIKYNDIARCRITRDIKEPGAIKKFFRKLFRTPERREHAVVEILEDGADADYLALSYDAVAGEDVPVDGFMSFRKLDGRVKEFIQKLLNVHGAGFTHNDMHLGNVMMDRTTGALKMIDYGRLCFSGLEDAVSDNAQFDRIAAVAGRSASTVVKKHGKWSPFRSDATATWSDYYWMTDLVMLSMQLYVAITTSGTYQESELFQRQCVVPFLQKAANEKGEEYDVADYDNPADLLAKVKRVKAPMFTLLPGLILYAIILKHIRDDGDEIDNRDFNYVYENYVVLQFGGDVLLSLFNGEYVHKFSDYDDVLEYAFGKAGLFVEGQYGAAQRGGAAGSELAELESLDSVTMEVPFQRDLVDAASWNDRMVGTRFVSAPDSLVANVEPQGMTARPPPALNFVDRPLVAPVSGGGRSTWIPAALAAVTVAMAFAQSFL